MKKTTVIIMCIIMSLVLSSCGLFVSSTGKKALEEGKLAMAGGRHTEALRYFELAQSEGVNSNDLIEMTDAVKNYIDAQELCNNGEYEEARKKVDAITITDATQALRKEVDSLKNDIQNGIDSLSIIDGKISDAERLFANGDYDNTELKIYEIENSGGLSESQKDKLALLKQQLKTAKDKIKIVYVSESDKESAKNAVTNFVYAYESFVASGRRTADAYSSFMSPYSPSWSRAYKAQWDYFKKHNITSYYIDRLTYESVTFDGKAYYVVDSESISEAKSGVMERSTTRWKYTVVKSDGYFKVTNYTKVK